MQVKSIGLAAVILTTAAIIGYKTHLSPEAQAANPPASPRVLLVADSSEANAAGDSCAEIIHLVRAARTRGVAVQELKPGSKSELLARYRVLIIPTVLILDPNGKEVSRYEGEGLDIVNRLRADLGQLK